MYIQHSTANPLGRRPWQSRLGAYTRATFVIPTQTVGQTAACAGCPASGLACGGCPHMGDLAATFPNIPYSRHPRLWIKREGPEAPVPRIIRPPELGAVTYGVAIPRMRRPVPIRTAAATIAARDFSQAARPYRRMIYLPRLPITEKARPATVAVAPAPKTSEERRAEFWALRRPSGQILPAIYRGASSPAPTVATARFKAAPESVTPAQQLGADAQPAGVMAQVQEWLGRESLISGVKNWWIAAGLGGLWLLRRRRA